MAGMGLDARRMGPATRVYAHVDVRMCGGPPAMARGGTEGPVVPMYNPVGIADVQPRRHRRCSDPVGIADVQTPLASLIWNPRLQRRYGVPCLRQLRPMGRAVVGHRSGSCLRPRGGSFRDGCRGTCRRRGMSGWGVAISPQPFALARAGVRWGACACAYRHSGSRAAQMAAWHARRCADTLSRHPSGSRVPVSA